ncbi:phage terminase large subunit GpA-like protein [Ensifer adhaerens]|uniref:Phage terminase large subunit GpA-like protein n=1 Tax=Ensifer adhaerens TaxID=106592 RepID=A0ACC5SXB7_ENSAD|nr:terminase gpA endonuclease subunit [Ensifer adhaerens]MBP1873532.1 phage terminase large subunit GpA-like protein [Ensifer adhaerens]
MTMLFNPGRLALSVLAEICEPPPSIDYLDWAKRHIVFSERITDHPGPYNEDLVPFFSEILRALSPEDPCNIVSLAKSAQIGGTICANIFTLGSLDMAPGDFLYVHPTEENAARWSKAKLMPLVREMPVVAKLFSQNSRDASNSVLYKERIDGRGAIQAAGANSPAGLSMISPRKQVQDDLAKWQMNEAGDPEAQADSRSKAFFNAKVFKISTPMVEPGCKITANYREGSQESYHVPCPHKECGGLQELRWENMRDHIDPLHPEKAHFVCIHCGGEIHEHHREWMVRPENGAQWVAKYPERARRHRSFRIWMAYSPFERWENLAREFISLQAGGPEKRDNGAGAEQTFFNDWLGLAYEADNKAVDWEVLRDRAEANGFARGVIPAGVLSLVLGLDVQGDRVEWLLVGYGRNRLRAVVDHGMIDSRAGGHLPGFREHSGHISEPEVRAALDLLLTREWRDEAGRKRTADLFAIDGNAYTDDVWNWVRKHPRSRVIMVRGGNSDNAPPIAQAREYDKKGKPKKQKWSSRFFTFASSAFKLRLYRDFKKEDAEQAGYISFARGFEDDLFQQATSESRVAEKTRSGHTRYVWKLTEGRRNEVLDMLNQSLAGAYRLGIPYWTDEQWDVIEDRLGKIEPPRQGDLEDHLNQVPQAQPQPAPPPRTEAPVRTEQKKLTAAEALRQLNR